MNTLNVNQMTDISAGSDCGYKIAAGAASGGFLGIKAGARLAPLLAWTGVGAGAIVIGAGVVGAIAGGLSGWGVCS